MAVPVVHRPSNAEAAAFLERLTAVPAPAPAACLRCDGLPRGHLERAQDLTSAVLAESLRAGGGLDVSLCHCRGAFEMAATPFLSSEEELGRRLQGIRCRGGHTQIARVLARALDRHAEVPLSALVLERTCPDAVRPHPLCPMREQIPRDSALFLWTPDGPFRRLGGFDAHPNSGATSTAPSWPTDGRPGSGLGTPRGPAGRLGVGWRRTSPWPGPLPPGRPPFALLLLPGEEKAILSARSARKARGTWGMGPHALVPVGLAMAACLLAFARRPRTDAATALLLLLAAWLGNAVLVGLGEGVHGRYQARIAWLLPRL
jgi:hypothetical protein